MKSPSDPGTREKVHGEINYENEDLVYILSQNDTFCSPSKKVEHERSMTPKF